MDEEKRPDDNVDKPKPGDNPNKRNMNTRKKFRQKKKNKPSNGEAKREYVDPLREPVEVDLDNYIFAKAPGKIVVGKIKLRHNFVDEITKMTRSALIAARDSLSMRIDFPEIDVYADSIVPMLIATQLFETLRVVQRDNGVAYKLKSLKHSRLQVPSFLPSLIQTIGTFETKEGIIMIEHSETLMLQFLQHSFLKSNVAVRYPEFEEFEEIPEGGFRYNDYPYKQGIWNTFDCIEYLRDVCEDIAGEFIRESYPFELLDGTHIRLRLPDLKEGVEIDQVESTINLIAEQKPEFPVERLLACYKAYAYNTYAEIQDEVVSILGHTKRPDGDVVRYVTYGGMYAQYVNFTLSDTISKLFKTSIFSPTTGGTEAQFVHSDDEGDLLMNSTANVVYNHSIADMAAGLLLVPSTRITFMPEYKVSNEMPRRNAFGNFITNFRTER